MTGRVLLLIVGLSVLKISDSKNCVKQNSCLCVFDDGSGAISLYDVGRNDGSPLIEQEVPPGVYIYWYNPCYPFTQSACIDVAACVLNDTIPAFCDIGEQSSVSFAYDGVNVIATYSARSCNFVTSTTVVTLICDPNVTVEGTALGQLSSYVYGFSVRSMYLCPTNIPTDEPTIFPTSEGRTTAPVTTEEPFTKERTTESFITTESETTWIPVTTQLTTGPPTTPKRPGIFCDYQSLLGQTLRMCVEEYTRNTVTPFAPPYLNFPDDAIYFCSNVSFINDCVEESIKNCDFDSRVTTFFGPSGQALQAAYNSLCAHTYKGQGFRCLTYSSLERYTDPVNEFIKNVDALTDPKQICGLGDKMALEIKRTISLYCGSQEVYMWSLFYQNFLAQCD